ncbi:type I-E CRISPR-associated protein Cas7/Cse4/CasC [Methylobacterium nodulans]|uniref:CRISPR-associated protein, Cse4 family n=1 Tax=Methylobacterium nodulans (strain LMG 21967 / CNCM I-2342 / ORS 2060) TaxID=460265 RepID=B8IMR3_METNO|nr:type I-E CRISPR-associated protein Cas7/Cse4/CasC [Methylobacterium nodulans]ACL60256.1 CRISPR-associated protein, Cse4 family [Methylobacterium nodulans ORS 2060]
MTTFFQLHVLTAYPPANLNRDDTGRPKTARVGNVDRLRVSSQALKRAWRSSDAFAEALAGHLGQRTQRLGETIEGHLIDRGADPATARTAARAVAERFGKLKSEGDKKPTHIEQLAFISADERKAAFALAERLAAGETVDVDKAPLLRRADGAVDVAMFGRMLADSPEFNREAAVQVAHAFTTHRAPVEDDYYTAVDDLKGPQEDAGAGFVGEAGFGSGLFYLYVCIDRDLLVRNLAGDEDLARAGLSAVVRAVTTVAPRGKQASFASRARASFGLLERGSEMPRTLAAAFLKPVGGEDVLETSIARLLSLRESFARAYGDEAETAIMNVPAGEGSLADLIALAVR